MTEDDAVELLSKAGLRNTPMRRAILLTLSTSDQPLDVPGLLMLLPRHTDNVTVYRTLGTFTRKTLVHRVRTAERSWRFAIGDVEHGTKHRHPHFVCEQCGKVECLAGSTVPPTLGRTLNLGPQYKIDYTEVIVHGSCTDCR